MNWKKWVVRVAGLFLTTSFVFAQAPGGVQEANKRAGHPNNVVATGFSLKLIAQGSDPLENPSGIITQFGYVDDAAEQTVEASKTEPDQNTYLVLDHNPGGPTAGYDYGRHFLFQGHELFSGNLAYVTRINLDVTDKAHRITLLTPVGKDGKTHLNDLDGSTWDPFTKTLLFTSEDGTDGGVYEIGVNFPNGGVHRLYGLFGRAGFEGIHPDSNGNLVVIEDVGGTKVTVDPSNASAPVAARNPNSFVYRFVPNNRSNLSAGGKLQALQVSIDGKPVKFIDVDANHATGGVFTDEQLKLHTLGTSYPVKWITIHDTATDGTATFDANAAAKKAGATPFKRPENFQFVPGSGFATFFFVPTGDTSSDSGDQPDLKKRGAYGSIFRVDFAPNASSGTISVFVVGTRARASFDNVAFLDAHTLLVAEDRGDGLHKQLNRLDSIWAFDIRNSNPSGNRFLALGRDPVSEKDAGYLDAEVDGYQNEGDNEPTGLHVSNGDPSVNGLLGTSVDSHARIFFTQQHGMNRVFEVIP